MCISCLFVHDCMCVYAYVYECVRAYVLVCLCFYVFTCVRVRMNMYAHVCECICVCACVYLCVYARNAHYCSSQVHAPCTHHSICRREDGKGNYKSHAQIMNVCMTDMNDERDRGWISWMMDS